MRVPSSLGTWIRLAALGAAAAAATGGCTNLDDVTTIKDLRVLAVQADRPGFLVDVDNVGATPAADLSATFTALIVDPKGQGMDLTFSAVGCPDLLDAITAATGAANASCTPDFPGYAQLTPDPPSPAAPVIPMGTEAAATIEYHPSFAPYGLAPGDLALLFTPQPNATPAVAQAIDYNRQFGVDAFVTFTFTLGAEQASAVKRILYWPDLRATFPDEVPNRNPVIDHLEFYRHRDDSTGDPTDLWDGVPVVSLAAQDKLYVLPVLAPDAIETYPLTSRDPFSGETTTRLATELLVFDYYTTAGTFAPARRENESPVFGAPGSPIHLDSQLNLPSRKDLDTLAPAGTAEVWVVVHDERAGVGWAHATVMITP